MGAGTRASRPGCALVAVAPDDSAANSTTPDPSDATSALGSTTLRSNLFSRACANSLSPSLGKSITGPAETTSSYSAGFPVGKALICSVIYLNTSKPTRNTSVPRRFSSEPLVLYFTSVYWPVASKSRISSRSLSMMSLTIIGPSIVTTVSNRFLKPTPLGMSPVLMPAERA